jgi:glycosyltransferase involved in cell wall biosynthesis
MGLYLQAAVGLLALYGAITLGVTAYRRARELVGDDLPPCFVSLLLVVRDKDQVIEGLVRDILSALSGLQDRNTGYELVAVDDRSRDQTAAILERMARRYRLLRVITMSEAAGRGESALEVGLVMCRSKVVLLCDAVGRVDCRQVLETVRRLTSGTGPGPERAPGRLAATG